MSPTSEAFSHLFLESPRQVNMRRIFVFFAIAAALGLSAVGLAASSTGSAHPAKVGYPNFVCVSTPYFGVCVGPPTRNG